jgi:hypothetical protein
MQNLIPWLKQLPWHFEKYDEGVLLLRHFKYALRIRFWPDAMAEIRLESDGEWQDAAVHAEALLNEQFEVSAASGVGVSDTRRCEMSTGGGRIQAAFDFDYFFEARHPLVEARYALASAFQKIPLPIRERLRYYERMPWKLLCLASQSRGVADLMQSNPMLLTFWLNDVDLQTGKFVEIMKSWVNRPQHVQLQQFGFAHPKRWSRILRKIPVGEMHDVPIDCLAEFSQSAIDSDVMKYLLHAKELPAEALRRLVDSELSYYVRREIRKGVLGVLDAAALERLDVVAQILKRMRELGVHAGDMELPKSLARLVKFHGQLLQSTLHVSRRNWRSVLPFKCPDGWQHLDTIDKVVAEGVEQQNCLVGEGCWFKEGHYLFKTAQPVRATLHVCEHEGAVHIISECEGRGNAEISPEHFTSIQAALHKVTGKSRQLAALAV